MNRLTTAILCAAAATLIALSSGCTHRAAHSTVSAVYFASAVAEIATAAAVLSYHDAHYHALGCGHRYRYHNGQYVYWYGGHWEYYDSDVNVWYAY